MKARTDDLIDMGISASCPLLIAVLLFSNFFVADGEETYSALMRSGRASLDAGEAPAAAQAFRQALENMQGAGVAPKITLPVLLALSTALLETGELSQAERILLKADQAADSNDDLMAAELANNWGCLHVRLGHHNQARTELAHTLARVEDSPAARKLIPNLLDNLANAEIYLGQYQSALLHQQQAVDRWAQLLPLDHPYLAKGWAQLSTAQYLCGEYASAYQSLEKALSTVERRYGKIHPLRTTLLRDEVIVLTRLGLKKELNARKRELSKLATPKVSSVKTYTAPVSTLYTEAKQ